MISQTLAPVNARVLNKLFQTIPPPITAAAAVQIIEGDIHTSTAVTSRIIRYIYCYCCSLYTHIIDSSTGAGVGGR